MITQFSAKYRVSVFSKSETTIVEYPITCKFSVTRGILSDSNKAVIELYNLAPSTRNQIFQDQLTLDEDKFKYVHLEAGYNDNLSLIFKGRILQAYSFKSGGQTDVITQIQAVAVDIFDSQTSHTFEAGTTFKQAHNTIASDMPNVTIGNIGNLNGKFKTPTTFDGLALEKLNTLTGGHTFVDNGTLNTLMDNEVIDVPVPVISNRTNLLETPMRRDANLEIKTTFLPDIIAGQLIEIDSAISPDFNGQFKLVSFTHDCLISPTVSGSRTTQMTLWIGPALPKSNINLTEGPTGGAASVTFDKVKNEQITSVNPKPVNPKWIMPCKGTISSPYGWRTHPIKKTRIFHSGIDIRAPLNTPVKAPTQGTVIFAAYEGPNGNCIRINHGKINGKVVKSTYIHLQAIDVRVNQEVKQGQKIGTVGSSGKYPNGKPSSTGPHLHLSVYENGQPVNPAKYIKF